MFIRKEKNINIYVIKQMFTGYMIERNKVNCRVTSMLKMVILVCIAMNKSELLSSWVYMIILG